MPIINRQTDIEASTHFKLLSRNSVIKLDTLLTQHGLSLALWVTPWNRFPCWEPNVLYQDYQNKTTLPMSTWNSKNEYNPKGKKSIMNCKCYSVLSWPCLLLLELWEERLPLFGSCLDAAFSSGSLCSECWTEIRWQELNYPDSGETQTHRLPNEYSRPLSSEEMLRCNQKDLFSSHNIHFFYFLAFYLF